MIPQTGKALIKLGAEWCMPCKMMSNVIADTNLSIPVVEIDIDEHPTIAQDYRVRSVPTLILIENGQEIGRKVGSLTSKQLQEFAEQ